MGNTYPVLAYPSAEGAISVVSNSSSWVFGAWATVCTKTQFTSYLISLNWQLTQAGVADTTHEILFEIGIGSIGDEATIAQIPVALRPDSLVGFYANQNEFCFPEMIYIPPRSRIAVRVANSAASAITYNGVKVLFQNEVGKFDGNNDYFEKFKYPNAKGMGSGVGWR